MGRSLMSDNVHRSASFIAPLFLSTHLKQLGIVAVFVGFLE
jgi:hypothetical protein